MTEQQVTEETVEQTPELTPVQQEALSSGWVPKEEFNGEQEKWVDAAEFLRRGELFKKIEAQGRELKDVRRALVEMKKLHSSVQEVEYKRALETLKAQKKTALEEGDADAVIAADERIDLVKEQQRQLATVQEDIPQAGEAHPEFVEWTQRNQWYTSSTPMKAFADALGQELASQGLTPPQVLKRVEEEVRKEFPNKFQNPRQNRASPVENGNSRSSSSSSSFQLSPDERRVMQTFVRTGAMTEAEYIKELKKVKGV
jgi:hypothetical protein